MGREEAATSLLGRIQRAHPGDFWINMDLARALSEMAQRDLLDTHRAVGRPKETLPYPLPSDRPPGASRGVRPPPARDDAPR